MLSILGVVLLVVGFAVIAGLVTAHFWLRAAARNSLPQIDGTIAVSGPASAVTVLRDMHGVPHIRASSLDDLVFAQGYVTAQDRLWQMETLRRHASGTLAEILGKDLLPHDRAQRLLQIRAAADRAVAVLPPDQLHWLAVYARGVNASMADQQGHLPVEFRLLGFSPAPWVPRDSLLVGLAMFQDLTNTFPEKLDREVIAAKLPQELVADLYPVGSWRDHPVVQPVVDLTTPVEDIEQIPLDESQTKLRLPDKHALGSAEHTQDLLAGDALLAGSATCEGCRAGSNNWVVSGSRSASGKPLLSNDMHLSHGVPGIWYEADLQAGSFHAAGVTLPGTPFVIVGHNDHVAWGFTNLGADVQDLTVEHLRGSGSSAEFQAADGGWQPLQHQSELIRVHHGLDVTLDVPETMHGKLLTPIISSLYPGEKRPISLRWTIYDPANITSPFLAINSAGDGASLSAAFAAFGGPSQNMVFADDQGHIGYHAVGRIPLRGDPSHPTPPSAIPADASVTANEWSTTAPYVPYDQLPHVADPAGGILATANARVVPDGFSYPITLDWAAPYRNERIWKVLAANPHMTSADMLALQTDVYSDLDRVIAQRLAYAIDHASLSGSRQKRLHQAADLLRDWNGHVDAKASAPAIVDAARAELWVLILTPKLGKSAALYTWGEKSFAEEQLIMHTPARWLPSGYATWDDLLADAVDKGMSVDHAPSDLATWQYGKAHPVDIEHPVLASSPLLKRLMGYPTGTGSLPQSGDTSTVKQVYRTFGPSERFTADLSDLDHSTLNLVLGQSGDPASPWFIDQFQAWYTGKTFPLPYTANAVQAATAHTLTLMPR
ncbi:penicillin acylase family protein [Granulicella arctica]|uniref:penicillin acylase family protein n=1 Tax=Granulicella arctica TaxID=940613 RepID=UPI0021E0639E|nr:penicillin acylase family protein [Granulicella arctica]